jgi:hypothetical protein
MRHEFTVVARAASVGSAETAAREDPEAVPVARELGLEDQRRTSSEGSIHRKQGPRCATDPAAAQCSGYSWP